MYFQYNCGLTYTERYKAEIIAECVNLFNHRSVFAINSVVTTNAAGNLTDAAGAVITTLPDFSLRGPSALDSRQFQLGFKFNF